MDYGTMIRILREESPSFPEASRKAVLRKISPAPVLLPLLAAAAAAAAVMLTARPHGMEDSAESLSASIVREEPRTPESIIAGFRARAEIMSRTTTGEIQWK